MSERLQFRTLHLLAAMTCVAAACLFWRTFPAIKPRLSQAIAIAAALTFFVVPFASMGALLDRMWTGILCGLAVLGVILLFSWGV